MLNGLDADHLLAMKQRLYDARMADGLEVEDPDKFKERVNRLDHQLAIIYLFERKGDFAGKVSVTTVLSRIDWELRRRGWVYFVREPSGLFKIGLTTCMSKRLASFQVATPGALELVHIVESNNPEKSELWYHQRFADQRVRGEWFTLSDADLAAIVQASWKRVWKHPARRVLDDYCAKWARRAE